MNKSKFSAGGIGMTYAYLEKKEAMKQKIKDLLGAIGFILLLVFAYGVFDLLK